jgi:hypothetical protein
VFDDYKQTTLTSLESVCAAQTENLLLVENQISELLRKLEADEESLTSIENQDSL